MTEPEGHLVPPEFRRQVQEEIMRLYEVPGWAVGLGKPPFRYRIRRFIRRLVRR